MLTIAVNTVPSILTLALFSILSLSSMVPVRKGIAFCSELGGHYYRRSRQIRTRGKTIYTSPSWRTLALSVKLGTLSKVATSKRI